MMARQIAAVVTTSGTARRMKTAVAAAPALALLAVPFESHADIQIKTDGRSFDAAAAGGILEPIPELAGWSSALQSDHRTNNQ
jgi:hypothetical protein